MKEWVRPYLVEQFERLLSQFEQDEETKHWRVRHFAKELSNIERVWQYLTEDLDPNTNFGTGGLFEPSYYFASMFGSVLSDLPKKAYLELRSMKHVFYIYTPHARAEVKHFILDKDLHDTDKWDRVIVVQFPYTYYHMPAPALRGSIAHVLAKTYIHSYETASFDGNKMEDKANALVTEWGFGEEIKALRKYQQNEEEMLV